MFMSATDKNADVTITNDEDANPYLAMRAAKIARNQKRLRELGLEPPHSSPAATTLRTKRKRSVKHKPPASAHNGPVRRSSRLSSKAASGYKTLPLPIEKELTVDRKLPRSVLELNDALETRVTSIRVQSPSYSVANENSVRSIDLDVKTLVLGKDNDALLGRMMEHTGKESVIRHSISLAASSEDQQRLASKKISFNKYCGVQDWKNAIFLWVNLGNNDSPNEFLDGAKQVTWFGGSRMHDQSPIILKLLKLAKEATKKKDGVSSNVVLWCRRYQPEVKKFTPYLCFGRMGYRSHVPGSRPLSFLWDLLDYDGLKYHKDVQVRETFDAFTHTK